MCFLAFARPKDVGGVFPLQSVLLTGVDKRPLFYVNGMANMCASGTSGLVGRMREMTQVT